MEPKSEHSPRRNLQVLSSGRWRHGCTTPVPTSAPIAAPVPPVIPLHALSLPLRKVEAGRNRDDTLMHDVGDPHFIGASIVVHTHNRPSWCILRFSGSRAPWVTETGS